MVVSLHFTIAFHRIPNTEFRCVDFFSPTSFSETFDVVYDYTFLCALPLSLRPPWAQRMATLVRPGGTLVTLLFPIADHTDGPPFAVNVDVYRGLLSETFKEQSITQCRSFPSREGKEMLGLWVRKETTTS
ncbi:hypothetical protein HMI56_001973 [Coelomomyces lativittatus]|nr:hypothetical protein HMI56_001973 [Coelomomyces lativittatus]